MSVPPELQTLPSQALDVIRYLAQYEQGTDMHTIMYGTGLSERAFGKAIRRLVTLYYVNMLGPGFYVLTANGKQAAQLLPAYEGHASAPAEPDEPRHHRRLTVMVPQSLALHMPVSVMAGFDAPDGDQPALNQPGRVVLRLSAPDCEVDPVERPLEVATRQPAGPVRFRITPRDEGTVRVRIDAYQLKTLDDVALLGSMYFDLPVTALPHAGSAALKPLGTMIALYTG